MDFNQDKVRAALRRLIEDRGVDMAAVSRAIGKNHAYIQQYLNRGVPADLGYKSAVALAGYFGCGVETFGIKGVKASNDGRPRHPIESIRRLIGLDAAQFARALNEKETDLADIEQGRKPLTEKLLLKICTTFEIEPEALAEYAPAMSADERVLLSRFRRLNPAQRRALDSFMLRFEKERA